MAAPSFIKFQLYNGLNFLPAINPDYPYIVVALLSKKQCNKPMIYQLVSYELIFSYKACIVFLWEYSEWTIGALKLTYLRKNALKTTFLLIEIMEVNASTGCLHRSSEALLAFSY